MITDQWHKSVWQKYTLNFDSHRVEWSIISFIMLQKCSDMFGDNDEREELVPVWSREELHKLVLCEGEM